MEDEVKRDFSSFKVWNMPAIYAPYEISGITFIISEQGSTKPDLFTAGTILWDCLKTDSDV